MPKFDGTGPDGKGSMTGRGRGYCVLPLEEVKSPMIWKQLNSTINGDKTVTDINNNKEISDRKGD
ncbi:DUF5320 domain-containing protein [Paramaledivibacter caminithermalis]|jgi:hypothetical protein|uniref:Uncharacterized protein n=1 Tax=Paramaledivibacter caminithermalis (strain DSM 15212 / CIP 107654 / DViRD3) TaxID=1121301 RepID=A0A1M6PMK2_PARC5|nr:DUF5320 domain-containing protein [Paramaledivibacter caminithermalis]SHK09143.1 hypothetical protein SAMN02745912_02216 [Paramaledivibacter caminithermalis DSM 15212]